MNQITSGGYSPNTLSKLPAIRTFQMDTEGVGGISNSVNLFRGDVNLPLELISLPGRGNLDTKVAIMYQSNIQNLVDTWNLEASTGILGLGWNMPYEMIAIDNKKTGFTYDDEYYLISGGSANRLHQDGVTEDGAWNFETEDYKPWDIRYYPKEEKWIIVKESGVKQIYGGKKDDIPANNQSIQWGLKWGGNNGSWMDSTINTSGQEPIALAWNLVEICNHWGEKVTFDYEVELKKVGWDGYNYTNACYLKKISALGGRTIYFIYKEKQYDERIREYQPPHEYVGSSSLNAYQDKYETKFLDSIEVKQESTNTFLFSLQFEYDLKNVSLTNFNSGDFYKRYLIGVTQKNAYGESLPGYKFEYYTNEIRVNNHRGALKSITYPAGGIATFTYTKENLVGTSHSQNIPIYGIPRVWFGGDYVVVADYNSGRGNLNLSIYSWNGNWIKDEKSISGQLDIESLEVVTQSNFFALSFKRNSEMELYLFHQEMGRFGEWDFNNYYLNLDSNDTQTHLAVGSDFVVACASGSPKLGLYVWDRQRKSWQDKSRTVGKGNYDIAAFGNYFILSIYDAAQKTCELALYYQDEIYQQWNRKDIGNISSIEKDQKGNPYLHWSLSNDSATATFIKKFDQNIDYEFRIYQWNTNFEINFDTHHNYSVPSGTKEPFQYSVTSGSLVANVGHLFRFNGSEWKEKDLTVRGEGTKFAYGSDLAIASSVNSSDIKAYDPYRDDWTNADIQGSWSKDEYQPTVSGNFITIGNAIFYKNNQGQLNKDRISIPSGIKPDSIINRAPYYIACETVDGQARIFFLKNGKVANSKDLSEKIYVDNESSKGRSGTVLAGFNTFVTYKGDDFNQASQLALHYVANESIEGNVIDFPVTTVTVDDGHQKNQTSYDYDTSKIVISVQGIVTEYARVTVIRGGENVRSTPFGKTEYNFFNGLSSKGLGFKDFKGIPPYYYSLLHGSLYQRKDYDTRGDEVTCQTVEYDIITQRQKLGELGWVNLYGFYIQVKREKDILYGKEIGDPNSSENSSNVGVKREVEYEYDSATGFLKKQTTHNYNSLGEPEILTQTSVYGWEKYGELKKQNILSPVIQTISKTDDKTTAIAVSTWKDWGENKWGVHKTYQALNEKATFDNWNSQTEPSKTDWLKVSEVIYRAANGVVQDSVDVDGVHSSVLLDKESFYPIAQFMNATLEEVTYTGFEAYEDLGDWRVNQGNLSDAIVTGDAHTGLSSLKLKPNVTLDKQTPLTIANFRQAYILSAWIKTESGFEEDGGKAQIKLQFYNNTHPIGSPIVVPLSGTESEWKYWHYALKPAQIHGTRLSFEISNIKASKSFLIDDICFVPLMGSFQGNVYEPHYKLVSATLGKGGDTARHLYDSFQRKVAEIGLSETVNGVTMPYLTRQVKDEATFVFPQEQPNSVLSIGAAEGGIYANFTSGEQWREEWQSSQINRWQVKNNALVHTGNTSDSITYQPTASFGNYGVRLSVHSSGTPRQPLGIGIGDQLTVTWTPNQGWTLHLNGTSSQISKTGSMPHEWLLVVANRVILFYADGEPIFAETIEDDISGALQLFATEPVAFSNIVTFKNPQIGMTYTDGAGKERQTQALDGSNCLVSETIYDVLGRPAITTKTARFDSTLLAYRQRFVETMDWESGMLTGEVASYYPNDQGYPYSRTVFEASPLGRPLQQGIPGKAFAVGNGNPHVVTREYGTNLQGFFAGDSYPSGQYLVEKLTDADGTPVYTLKDLSGQTLAKKAGPIEAGSEVYQISRSIYDAAGNVVKVLLPNHFVPPAGSQPDAWEITMEYNFLGQMTRQTNPNSGTTKYIYDKAGRPRFMVDAEGSVSQTILYKKYDVMGRLIEDGWFAGDWDGQTLQEKADTDPNYPEQTAWRKRYLFDGDGSNPHLVGRLWKVLSSNQGDGNTDVEEVYEYDAFGNVASKTLTVTGYAAQTVRYEYDNLGNVTKVRYPDDSSNPIPEVVYSYNSLGETIAVGTPENPQRFASYRYNADGSLATTTLNDGGIRNNLNYNSPGWPTRIDNQKADNSLVMEQSLAYTEDGYGGAEYYNGNIAKNSINYGTWENAPLSYDYQYQYDKLGRLKVAQNSRNERASLGVGEPTTYDINGNLETLKQGERMNEYEYIQNTDKVNGVSNGSEPQFYRYDANGNVKVASHRQISEIDYDPLTQLTTQIQVEGEVSKTVAFKYNGANQRVLKTSRDSSGHPTATKLYVHGLNDYPLSEVSDQSVQYVYGIGGLLALVKDGKVYTILKDHLGSTRMVVDEAGTVIAAFDYLPFGDLMGVAYGNPEIISYRYTGQEFDAELGLYNYRARFYDSRLGRFYATDPKSQFASPYLYAGNNPVIMVDPDGKFVFLAIGALVGAVIGGVSTAYTGVKAGLKGRDLAGYIAAGAGIGAVAGVVSAAGGVVAFAAGAAVGTLAGGGSAGLVLGTLAGAGVGSLVGAGVGAGQAAVQFVVNEALGVKNQGSLSEVVRKGALIGGIGGAITGGIAGFGGAKAAAQSLLALRSGLDIGHPLQNAKSLNNAYDAFTTFGSRPEKLWPHTGRWLTALPTKANTLSIRGTIATAGVKKVIEKAVPNSNNTNSVGSVAPLSASPVSYSKLNASFFR